MAIQLAAGALVDAMNEQFHVSPPSSVLKLKKSALEFAEACNRPFSMFSGEEKPNKNLPSLN